MSDKEAIRPPHESIDEFAVQDWLIIVEALATCAGPPPTSRENSSDTRVNGALTRPRTHRAWELVSAIVAEIDLPPGEIVIQIDDDWRGPASER